MIVTENFKVGERDFIRTTSDAGRYVVRDGVEYSEACDPAEFGRQYKSSTFFWEVRTHDQPSKSLRASRTD